MLRNSVLRVAFFAALGLAIGLIVAFASPRLYEARIEVLVGQAPDPRNAPNALPDDVSSLITQGRSRDMETERQLISSDSVFLAAVAQQGKSDLNAQAADLLLKYDVVSARRPTNLPADAPGVLQLRVRAYNQNDAVAIAEEIPRQYERVRTETGDKSIAAAVDYVERKIGQTEKALATAQDAYRNYKAQIGIADLPTTLRDQTSSLTQLEQTVNTLGQQVDAANAEVASLAASLRVTPKEYDAAEVTVRNGLIDTLTQQITEARSQRELALRTYTERAPEVRAIDRQINVYNRQLAVAQKAGENRGSSTKTPNPIHQNIETQLNQAKARQASAQASLNKARADRDRAAQELKALPAYEAKLAGLQREISINEAQYAQQKTLLADVRDRAAASTSGLISLSGGIARPTQGYREPDPFKFGIIGLIGGSCLGLLFAFLSGSLNQKVSGSLRLSEVTGLPVLAALQAGRDSDSSAPALQVRLKGGARAAESFRYLAATLVARGSEGARSFLFCGTRRSGPAAVSALNFAHALREEGKRVVLVDGDGNSTALSRIVGNDKSAVGFIQGLVHPSFETTVKEVGGLGIVTYGAEPGHALSPTEAGHVPAFIQALTALYDVVIVLGAPCDVAADTAFLVPAVDEVVLAVSERTTSILEVLRGQELLARAGALALSLVLVDAKGQQEAFTGAGLTTRRSLPNPEPAGTDA